MNEIELEIRKILWEDWDPIGCGVPEDEYDSYVPRIYALLEEGADVSYIAATLEHISAKLMASPTGEDYKIATKLYEMYIDKTGGVKTTTVVKIKNGKPVKEWKE